MKTSGFVFLIACIVIMFACGKRKTIDIVDTRQYGDSIPGFDSKGKTDKDFILYRPFDKTYGIITYRKLNDQLVSQGFLFADFYDYNKAKYRWVNDSTLTFTMYGKIHESDRFTMKLSSDGSFKLERGN